TTLFRSCALARQYLPLRGDGLFRNSGAEPKEPFNLECLFRTEAHVAGVFDAPINGQNARRKRIPRRGVVGFEVLDRDGWDDVTGDAKVHRGTDRRVNRERVPVGIGRDPCGDTGWMVTW